MWVLFDLSKVAMSVCESLSVCESFAHLVVQVKVSEYRHPDFKWDGERYVVEDTEARGHRRNLAFGEEHGDRYFTGKLLFFEAKQRKC
jgi:hypothetical protein